MTDYRFMVHITDMRTGVGIFKYTEYKIHLLCECACVQILRTETHLHQHSHVKYEAPTCYYQLFTNVNFSPCPF